jgi:hypothetical protein
MRQRLIQRLHKLEKLEDGSVMRLFSQAFHDYKVNGIMSSNQKHLKLIRRIDDFIESALDGYVPSMPDIYQEET